MSIKSSWVYFVLCFVMVGCSQFDGAKVRHGHAETFAVELAEKTAGELPPGQAVGLNDCIRIALANNLDVQTAQINRRLARLDRKIAFSSFLPQINVGVQYHSSARQQARAAGDSFSPVGDRSVMEAVLSAQQTIFTPETWFLYEAYIKGEDISELVARRTRDLIRLQVTTLYFACLSHEQAQQALELSVEQARALLSETELLWREGLTMLSQVEQARTLVKAQEANLASNLRMQLQMRAALLEAMGLSPTAHIDLKTETPLTVEEQELPDQILYAMLHRPELHAADRVIAIRKDETKIAISQFLPKLMGFSDLNYTSDSFFRYGNMWLFGISGILSVFDGFANVHEYRAAREREKQAAIDREYQCLQIMLEVIQARMQYDQAIDQQKVYRQELFASKLWLHETEALWKEGLLMTSERLDVVTRHAAATANALAAEFQVQVTAATLLDVMGVCLEGSDYEKTK